MSGVFFFSGEDKIENVENQVALIQPIEGSSETEKNQGIVS